MIGCNKAYVGMQIAYMMRENKASVLNKMLKKPGGVNSVSFILYNNVIQYINNKN